jgi:hypothetical protein
VSQRRTAAARLLLRRGQVSPAEPLQDLDRAVAMHARRPAREDVG